MEGIFFVNYTHCHLQWKHHSLSMCSLFYIKFSLCALSFAKDFPAQDYNREDHNLQVGWQADHAFVQSRHANGPCLN